MGIRVGIDLLEVDEVRESIRRHGVRYEQRMLTAEERARIAGDPFGVADAVAAKEATFKALSVPADVQAVWTDVEIDASRARLTGDLGRAHPGLEIAVCTSRTRRSVLAVAIASG